MSRWFRFYEDVLNDPKILKLPDETYRGWTLLLCVASKNNGTLPETEDVAIMLRMSVSEVRELIDELKARGLLDETPQEVVSPHNWRKRQYKSDVSTERVKRFRKRFKNVSVTPPETETETETETEKKVSKITRKRAKTKILDDWKPPDRAIAIATSIGVSIADTEARFKDYLASTGRLYADYDAAFCNFVRNAPKFNGVGNGPRGSRSLQDDSLSVGKAAERIAISIRGSGFAPRPSLLPSESESDLRLLPPRRST